VTEDGGVAGAYRGFLFADLRGYTAFGEAHGDRAAADLLDAYRILVRDEVARHAGAEIRTEGDSFYVVFASARDAVSCGLSIVEAAARYSTQHPEAPLRIGIGINAGETVQRGEAFVGSAVNLAARVCAQARAGEVLVTSTVRDVARGGSTLRFVPRGVRRFKGISDRVPVFAVTATELQERKAPSWRIRPSAAWIAIAAAVVVGVAIAAFAIQGGWLDQTGLSGSAAPSVASEQPLESASASAVTAGPSPSESFPAASETALLSKIGDEIWPSCERADLDDRPRINIDREIGGLGGSGVARVLIPVTAGVACKLNTSSAPTTLHYWATKAYQDFDPVGLADALIVSEAATFEVPPGDCASEQPAYGRWEFGGTGGRLLCRTSFGDAILEWTYDDVPLVAVATRRDGDAQKLLQWWRDQARFLRGD
jgi:class 3 adenylate cyclase